MFCFAHSLPLLGTCKNFLCLCSLWWTLTLVLPGLPEFRKKNADKKAAVSKEKGSEMKKKRKLEDESSDKGEGEEVEGGDDQ